MAGIHPSPGPDPCGVCGRPVTWRETSFRCYRCGLLVHKLCSGLSRVSQYYHTWTCPRCNAPPPPFSPPTAPLPPPTPRLPDGPFFANGPPPAPAHFLQFNCNGLRHCAVELAHFLVTHSILVAAIQESKLTEVSNPPDLP
ncbi:hypothetical protein HAZT_HAZT012201 [Hyalella azteca]|uniref:Phorbol-ester/DAG-type domain-containing protein n=1 Tax=Hyalella azteca TaxID=294128 RepID=A0A6A0H6S1_HYAAZ|nr:hypothetical protein HAZT_HAZT012201 [Hyalella azteca]